MLTDILMKVLYIYLIVINAAAFLLMLIDKVKAKKNLWRIPEATLFLFAALMGGVGGTLGMFFFRHKTKHWYFRLGFPALAAVQLALLALLGGLKL